jgi:hypothetical protein
MDIFISNRFWNVSKKKHNKYLLWIKNISYITSNHIALWDCIVHIVLNTMILGWCESVYEREYRAYFSVLYCLSILQGFLNRKSTEKYKSNTFYFFTTIHFQLQVPKRIEKIWLCFVLIWGGVTPISRLVIENGHSTILCVSARRSMYPSGQLLKLVYFPL